ncbi:hypothetical protein GCM10009847_27030 [Leucobacter tardus]|uniref:DUF6993 domain-containing protein n=1 Tax=Leucobacter tardus TaxID=501483 RepID=A0A939QJA5_9MICO|nr:hypothetical protein [Leucobacter tardus]
MRGRPSNIRRAAASGAIALMLTSLTGCFLLEGPSPRTPERTAPVEPETAPEFMPDGSATDNLPYFTEVLRQYSAGDGPVEGQPIVNAVAESGFDKSAMSVSFDESKTGYAADSIFVSVRIGPDCLLGQIAAEGRGFAAEAEPAIGPDQDVCLIGETRPIDW